MTSPLYHKAISNANPWIDVLHQLPTQLNDYTSFLQNYGSSLLQLKSQAHSRDKEALILRPEEDDSEDLLYLQLQEEEKESLFYLQLQEEEKENLLYLQLQEEEQGTFSFLQVHEDQIASTTFIMSNQQSTFHSQTYTSSSYSSSSDGQAPRTWRQTEHTSSNSSGTTVHRTSEEPGQAPIEETLRYDSSGKAVNQPSTAGRIEDVTDADREYEERIEDEYAKREGGA